MRYMDDMVILGKSKKKLHKMHRAIETYLNENLDLEIKRESRENREEMKTLRERVVIVEQSLKSYHKRLDGEQHSDR